MASSSDIRPARCPSCRSGELRAFFDLSNIPTHINFLCDTREAALESPRGEIHLVYCRGCGLISNSAFDPKRLEYREGYENSLHYSTVFQKYAESQADRLIEDFAEGTGGSEFCHAGQSDCRLGMAGTSYKFPNKTAWDLIKQRFPVSLIFGVTTFATDGSLVRRAARCRYITASSCLPCL